MIPKFPLSLALAELTPPEKAARRQAITKSLDDIDIQISKLQNTLEETTTDSKKRDITEKIITLKASKTTLMQERKDLSRDFRPMKFSPPKDMTRYRCR